MSFSVPGSGSAALIAGSISSAVLSTHAFASPLPLAPAALAKASSAGWVDGAGLALVLVLAGLGALRGLWWQTVRLCGVVAAFSVARALAPRFSPTLERWFDDLSPRLANGLAWTLVLLAGTLAVALIGRAGKAAHDSAGLPGFDRAGGALSGALCGLLLHTGLIVAAVQVAPRDFKAEAIDGTHSQAWIKALDRAVPNLLDRKAREALESERWRF